MAVNPPIDLLNDDEVKDVVEILRAAGDFGTANRVLRERFPSWNEPRRLAALRQGQNQIFATWQKSAARKHRERLVQGHAGEEHKENR